MADLDGTAYILFLEKDRTAHIVFGGENGTEPLESVEELLCTLHGLCKMDLIDESTLQVLQRQAHRIPIAKIGLRPKLLSDGVKFGKLRIVPKAPISFDGTEAVLPKPTQVM